MSCDACGSDNVPRDEVLCRDCKHPPGITPARARELLAMRRHGDIPHAYPRAWSPYSEPVPGGITREEDAAIKRKWNTLEGDSTYMHALEMIAREP